MDASAITLDVPPPSIAPSSRKLAAIEAWLEAERAQLPLWLPVAYGSGVAAWFGIATRLGWLAWLAACAGIAVAGLVLPASARARRLLLLGGLASALGLGASWARSELVRHDVIARPQLVALDALVMGLTSEPARERFRLMLEPDDAALPRRVRITVKADQMPKDLRVGERIAARARLVPPPDAIVPGAYDFARAAWFQRIGAVGAAMGRVRRRDPPRAEGDGLRDRLSRHVLSRLSGSEGGIAAAFASGDRGGIAKSDEDAMRASGLTHLLSISGLHVTAVVAFAMWLALRLLALSPRLALALPLPAIAAGCGAAAGIGYTLLTGAEVPTIRSCVAAVLVVAAIAMGRQALTLRLVAAGALFVLVLWPESLIGASFQLSFAAITAIVALHEWPPAARLLERHDESRARKVLRSAIALLVTGLVVEAALAPIALYHFHREGLYGALANIIAIPLTTFVIMPAEALALAFDAIGVGEPFWWLTRHALSFLLWLARSVTAWPGAQATLADMPASAFGLAVVGLLWLALWQGSVRAWGFAALAAALALVATAPRVDLIVTRDGRHLAVRNDQGAWATLRPRAGDFVREALATRGGTLDPLDDLDDHAAATCSDDSCRIVLNRGGREWTILATRSAQRLDWAPFVNACRATDIVVSDRRLPDACRPRWLKADTALLRATGGLAVALAPARISATRAVRDDHPWVANAAVDQRRHARLSHHRSQ